MVAVRLLTPPELVSRLDAHVIGQAHAKRKIAMAVYRHFLGHRLRALPQGSNQDLGPQHQSRACSPRCWSAPAGT